MAIGSLYKSIALLRERGRCYSRGVGQSENSWMEGQIFYSVNKEILNRMLEPTYRTRKQLRN
jgi:hypothetical protein